MKKLSAFLVLPALLLAACGSGEGTPGAPLNVTATAGVRSAQVSWNPPASEGAGPITQYSVTAAPGGAQVVTDQTSATVSGLANGTAYVFTVQASNNRGAGLTATSNEITTPALPPVPAGVTATGGDTQATVSWNIPSGTITSFVVTSSPEAHTATAAGTATSAVVTGLTNYSSYTFTVIARNQVGDSTPSASSNAVTPAHIPCGYQYGCSWY